MTVSSRPRENLPAGTAGAGRGNRLTPMDDQRRKFIHFLVSAAVSGSVYGLLKVADAKALPRPPAALKEADFLRTCARCYRCIDVCAPGALAPASIFDGIANLGTPVLDPSRCIFCMECLRACPTGAICKIPKKALDIGVAVIDPEICLAWQKKKRCKDCYKACKEDAIKMEKNRFPVVIAERCNGCGACVRRCPTQPLSVRVFYQDVPRYDPPEKRIAVRPEDRIGPYEFPPDDFKTWLGKRLRRIGANHGLVDLKEND